MTRTLSQKFRFFTFVCIALLVYVHGYNLEVNYLAPFSTVEEPLTFTTFFEYFMANGILRFRIPLLFLISGYLFALYDHRSYFVQIKNRFRTLIIPYLLWSALALLFTFLLQQNSFTAKIVQEAGIDQLGDNRPYTEIGWQGMLIRWLRNPIAFQLWFILALFIYNLLYPLIRWMIIKVPYIWLPLTFLFFFSAYQVPFIDGRGLFFFSFGIYLQKKNIEMEKEPKWFSLGLMLIFFIGINLVKTFMAFELEQRVISTSIVLLVMYQVSVLAGMMAIWFGSDRIIKWSMNKKWFHETSGFSFFIFGMHVPLLPYTMKWALMTFESFPGYRLACYLIIPLIIVILSIITGRLLRKYLPRTYSVLTGGRGF